MKRSTSVVFGLSCSPFLLEATIKYHREKYFNRDFNSEIVEHFLQDLYMDDRISGAQREDALFKFYLCVKILPNEGGFNLRKWITNFFEILNKIDCIRVNI